LDLAVIETALRQAIGRRTAIDDYVAPVIVARLAATLEVDAPRAGDALPTGWHMIFGLEVPRRADLDTDGLPRAFNLIPHVDMPRRMFGGARLSFHAPLMVGQPMRCESELADTKVRSTAGCSSGDCDIASSVFRPRRPGRRRGAGYCAHAADRRQAGKTRAAAGSDARARMAT
jgi:3-methylfumaryl-CoA hydratase